MSILSTNNLGISFGALDLFHGVSVSIARDGKIGLIGPNGVGKTSLLRLLAGLNAPTSGQVHVARNRRLGYLCQEAVDAFADSTHSVYAELLTVFKDLQVQQARLHTMEAEMSKGNCPDALLREYGSLQESFTQRGGYEYELRIQKTLNGLGLDKRTWEMPLQHLSGGQKTRTLLARLLLDKSDLLILDEPTNHLDIEAVEWLEHTLREWEGAALIVSHDRFFLDNTVNIIWELKPDGIDTYAGNYSAYLLQRQDRWEYHRRVFEEEKARMLKEIVFIQKNWVRASTHARALGRLRLLTRDLAIVENHGILALRNGKKWSEMEIGALRPLDVTDAIRKVNAVSLSCNRPAHIRPRLKAAHTSGNIVLRIDKLTAGYPGNILFEAQNIELRRGECAALIGPNGSGKTTFLKVLLEQVRPLRGDVVLGASLKTGYLAQSHDTLNGKNNVLEELIRHKEMPPGEARSYLAKYLFQGDDIFKPVSALSGGEHTRLALAILELDGANFLLLDEPTNHLDIPARETLQEVLENFSGTILLVTHDRYLIDQLATQIWEIHDHRLDLFQGKYREFILHRSERSPQAGRHLIPLNPRPLVRDNSRDTRRRMQNLNLVEERIREQETTLQRLSDELQKAGKVQSYEQIQDLSWQIARAHARLEELMSEWEVLVG